MIRSRKSFVVFSALMLVVLAGCGSSSKSSSSSAPAPAANGPAQTVNVSLTDFAISPSPINVQAGTITFNAKNAGQSIHDFAVKATDNSKNLGTTKNLDPGESGSTTINLQKGTYIAYCSEPGHESLGMKVSLVVS